jgi:hypothetical protein
MIGGCGQGRCGMTETADPRELSQERLVSMRGELIEGLVAQKHWTAGG